MINRKKLDMVTLHCVSVTTAFFSFLSELFKMSATQNRVLYQE